MEQTWEAEFAKIFNCYNARGWCATLSLPMETVDWMYNKIVNHYKEHSTILLVCNFLKEYHVEDSAALQFNICTHQYEKKLWDTVDLLNSCLPEVKR